MLVLLKYRLLTWAPLKDLKESNPIELAEYTVTNQIEHESDFVWWAPFTLKKRDYTITKIKAKYLKNTHKFGIRVLKDIVKAYAVYK